MFLGRWMIVLECKRLCVGVGFSWSDEADAEQLSPQNFCFGFFFMKRLRHFLQRVKVGLAFGLGIISFSGFVLLEF